MKKIIIFLITYVLVVGVFCSIIVNKKDEAIQRYLANTTHQYKSDYDILYDKNKKLSNVVFMISIDTKPVREIFKDATLGTKKQKNEARERLYSHLNRTYEILKQLHIEKLHFHLPNNESFLRFHKPERYGDNLTSIRATVEHVNKTQKPIDGFEEGKGNSGFRFVFPMFYKSTYIGSVEISFKTLAINLEFMRNYGVTSSLLVKKSIVDQKVFEEEKSQYTDSLIEDFYIEKAMEDKSNYNLSDKTLEIINQKSDDNKDFSLYDTSLKEVLTIIKVQNSINKKIVGLFLIRSDASYIHEKIASFRMIMVLANIFIFVVLFFIYKEMKYRDQIEQKNKKLKKSTKEISALNQTLEDRIQEEVEKNRKKDKHILHQSRLAQMGEMISMIAHQWRQPLGAISSTSIDMRMQIELGTFDLDKKDERELYFAYFIKRLDSIEEFVQNLTTTIDDFRNFYKPNKESKDSSVDMALETALKIVRATFLSYSIEIIEKLDDAKVIEMHTNEIVQVFLNILKNAQDNFREKNMENPKIYITSKNSKDGVCIEFCDNGGGISDDIIDQVFDPYFSTKDEKNGTGLGLYMSKMIVEEHHKGSLTVKNHDDGVCFRVELRAKIDTVS